MRSILVLSLCIICFCSCQKDVEPLAAGTTTSGTGTAGGTSGGGTTPTGSGTISASVDGKMLTFNTAAQAVRTGIVGMSSIAVVGFEGAPGTSDQISIVVTSLGTLGTGTYSYDNLTGTNIGSLGYVKYGDPSPYASFLSTGNPSRVVITALTATSIAGTFTGDAFQFSATGTIGAKKAITQGAFNVKFN